VRFLLFLTRQPLCTFPRVGDEDRTLSRSRSGTLTFPSFSSPPLFFLSPLRSLVEYWADSASTVLAPGGSIQRIGYDSAAFEEAVRVIILGEEPTEGALSSSVGLIESVKELENGEKEEEVQVEGYKTNKEDLAVVVRCSLRISRC
jgi:hypothetical protein